MSVVRFITIGDATLVVLIYEIRLAELNNGRGELRLDEAEVAEIPKMEALLQWLEIIGNEAALDAEAGVNTDATSIDLDSEMAEWLLQILSTVLKTEDLHAVVFAVATSLVTLAPVVLATNLAEVLVLVSSWARIISAKGITMMASRVKSVRIEIFLRNEWAEFKRVMMTEGRGKTEK